MVSLKVMTVVKKFAYLLYTWSSVMPSEKINRYTSYVLLAFLFGPHGAKECIEGICNGPNFVNPMLFTFLAPNWTMDMSWGGWGMQLIFTPPLIFVLYMLFRLSKTKYGKIFELYIVRWGIMWVGILWYYNYIFWSGPLREYIFPLFVF